jgi:hypothetical protein
MRSGVTEIGPVVERVLLPSAGQGGQAERWEVRDAGVLASLSRAVGTYAMRRAREDAGSPVGAVLPALKVTGAPASAKRCARRWRAKSIMKPEFTSRDRPGSSARGTEQQPARRLQVTRQTIDAKNVSPGRWQ